MLFKLTSSDVRNTTLIHYATDTVTYRISTTGPLRRRRNGSRSSSSSSVSSCSSQQHQSPSNQSTTTVEDRDGRIVAEIVWEGKSATIIRIGDEVLEGTTELFDAAFVKVLPDETLVPTRMEYVWRTTPDSLTLLNDDSQEVGKLYPNHRFFKRRLTPCRFPVRGHDYLHLDIQSQAEILELVVSYILISTLRTRLYYITKYVYGHQGGPFANLRRRASRHLANIRETIRLTVVPHPQIHI
ncbi:hypothetical protein A0H81_14253 [Grifola frondosa]|uniref:DUF6593 domain-containing protein n=1 Tax=Grifola frondosa TaxID=5627 RepID=A0A1C7LMD2_GRIFR|nr:hypothetical protein A0H81_14253 [Grifola frondosa]